MTVSLAALMRSFQSLLRQSHISLFAIDEAHCVSQVPLVDISFLYSLISGATNLDQIIKSMHPSSVIRSYSQVVHVSADVSNSASSRLDRHCRSEHA
jgi:hypothetical protein